ncbi:MAG: DUF4115 domain-containing protein [Magnetococcus sp. MYC-9]
MMNLFSKGRFSRSKRGEISREDLFAESGREPTSEGIPMGSSPTAAQVGAFLRQVRERQGLSVGEMSRRTRIRDVYLLALEAGEVEKLPGATFVAGFLRLYAESLEVADRGFIERYLERSASDDNLHIELFPAPTQFRHRPSVWMVLGGMIGLLGLFFVYENYFSTLTLAMHTPELPSVTPRRADSVPAGKGTNPADLADPLLDQEEEKGSMAASLLAHFFDRPADNGAKEGEEEEEDVPPPPVATRQGGETAAKATPPAAPQAVSAKATPPAAPPGAPAKAAPPAVSQGAPAKVTPPVGTQGQGTPEKAAQGAPALRQTDRPPEPVGKMAEPLPSATGPERETSPKDQEDASFPGSLLSQAKTWFSGWNPSTPAKPDEPRVEPLAIPPLAPKMTTTVKLGGGDSFARGGVPDPAGMAATVTPPGRNEARESKAAAGETGARPPSAEWVASKPVAADPASKSVVVEPKPAAKPPAVEPPVKPVVEPPVKPVVESPVKPAVKPSQDPSLAIGERFQERVNSSADLQPESDQAVSLLANELVWVQIQDEKGQVLKDMVMQPNHLFRVPVGGRFFALLGNAGAVRVRVGKRELPYLGAAGEELGNVELTPDALLRRAKP